MHCGPGYLVGNDGSRHERAKSREGMVVLPGEVVVQPPAATQLEGEGRIDGHEVGEMLVPLCPAVPVLAVDVLPREEDVS
jgi:hypothetical protein